MHATIRTLCVVALTVFGCLALWALRQTTLEAKRDFGGLTSQARTTMQKINAEQDAQSPRFDSELREIVKATSGASDFFRHTDITLNGPKEHPGLIPQATLFLDRLNTSAEHLDAAIQNLNAVFVSANATVGQLQQSLKQVDALTAELQAQVSDPSIKLALENLAKAAQNAATGTGELAATTADVRQIADKARETYLKPVNLWWGLVKELLPLAGSAAQVVK